MHPRNYYEGYYLKLGNEKAKRISYGASLSKTKVEPQFIEVFKKIITDVRRLDCISVREEKSARLIIGNLLGA